MPVTIQYANSEGECRRFGQEAFIRAKMIRWSVGLRTDWPRVRSRGSTCPWSKLFPARHPPLPWSFTPAA